jgi:hypothetical protein
MEDSSEGDFEEKDEINKHKFIYDVIDGRYLLERDRSKVLDDKASNIISFVGIILGLQGALGIFLLKEIPKTAEAYHNLSNIFLLGIILLTISIFCGLMAYRIRPQKVVPDTGEALIEEYGNTDEDFLATLTMISVEKADSIRINNKIGDDKVRYINGGFFLLVAGITVNVIFIYELLIARI